MPQPDQKTSVVIHGVDPIPQILEVGPDHTVGVLLRDLADRGFEIDMERATIAIVDADGDLEIDTILVAVIEDGCHIHVRHHCREIRVDVRFQGEVDSREFRSNRTILKVLEWAEERFNIAPAQRGQYRLKLPTSNEYLPNDMLLGELVPKEPCEVKLDLVRSEQNAGTSDEEKVALTRDLSREPFMRGFATRRWGPVCVGDGWAVVPLRSRKGQVRALRLDLAGYPTAPPQATFWDLQIDARLSSNLWPVLPDDNKAFRTDWFAGNGLYIACDRSALSPNGHPEWAQTHTNTNWRPEIGIARYLAVVADLLDIASVPAVAA